MTETLNLDDWLDGSRRNTRSVTLYGRADLLAEIDELEAQLRQTAQIPEEDRAMSESPGGDVQKKIDALYLDLDASKMVFRVSFIDDDQLNEIQDTVKTELKDEADKAAAKARQEAREKCKRLDITQPTDINMMIRTMANAAADAVIQREVNVRTISAAVVSPSITPDQVRKLYSRLGDAQIGLLSKAYSRAANEAPQVTVPKSSRPSHSGETDTYS